MSDQRVKKKSLSIEEFVGLLKIDNFGGKFQQGEGVALPVEKPRVQSAPKVSAIHSFKLKEAMAEAKDYVEIQKVTEVEKVEKKIKAQDAFDTKAVSVVLSSFVDDSAGEAIRVALTSHTPKVNGFVITLEVDNEFLLAKMNDLHPQIIAYLTERLNNSFITLNFELYKETGNDRENKRLFTSKDKFEHFVKLNPAVGELRSLFGLEIE